MTYKYKKQSPATLSEWTISFQGSLCELKIGFSFANPNDHTLHSSQCTEGRKMELDQNIRQYKGV